MLPHDVIERCRAGFWGCVTTLTAIQHGPGCLTLRWDHGPKLTFTDHEDETP